MDRVSKMMHASYAYEKGIYGRGIGVAVLDTGIGMHADLKNQIAGFHDFCNNRFPYYDDNGHGTHVAGIIAGSGGLSDGKYMGIAPGSHLVVAKVLDHRGNGNTSTVLDGIHWCIRNKEKYTIRILNISVGMLPNAGKAEQDRLIQAVEEAWENDIVVVAAAGNNGPATNSVTIPGICRTIITVGSSDDETSGKESQIRKRYSGCGPTAECVQKPEVIAPGTGVVSCSLSKKPYEMRSGTSMSTPVVSGCIALLLEKYPNMRPADVKLRLYERSVRLSLPRERQGWGLIDIRQLL